MLLLITIIIIITILIIYFWIMYKDMTYVKSELDGNYYLVRNTEDKMNASNTLAKIKENILLLSDTLYEKKTNYPEYTDYINRLYNKARHIIIMESTQDSMYTSYSINKGEQIVFCLRTRKTPNNLHDINLMMYVVIHEISHVASPTYEKEYNNHGPIFKKIFKFLTEKSIELGLYRNIDFASNPLEYCGMMITDSIV